MEVIHMMNGTLKEHIKVAEEKIADAEKQLDLAKERFRLTTWESADDMRYEAINMWEMDVEIKKVKELNKFIMGLYGMGE